MKILLLTAAWLVSLALVGCGDDDSGKTGSSRTGTGGTGGKGSAGGAAGIAGHASASSDCDVEGSNLSGCSSAALFDWSSVPVFDLTLPPAAWANLKKNARDEQYTEAELTFENKLVGKVALRFKGGYGTLLNCFDSNGNQTCKKLSMKLKFNEYDPDKRFFGLKHLNFHSMIGDGSQLHDRISYRLFREMGVVAPRSTWATIRVNGETQGLYAMVEQIDGRFTSDRWPTGGDGNLYKEAMVGFEEPSYFADHLETNEETATHEGFVAFSHALNTAAPAERNSVLGTYTDLAYLGAYMAVDDAIYNWDGITGIYTALDGSFLLSHNFYVYEEPTRPFFWLIPWDLDNTLSLSNGFGLVPNWTRTPADCSKPVPVFGGQNYVVPPGCSAFFQAISADLGHYKAAVEKLLAGPFAEAKVLEEIERDAAFIAEAVKADPLGPGASSWTTAVAQLKADIPALRARLEGIVAGRIVDPLTLSAKTLNDFEAFSRDSAKTGPILMVNAGSTATPTINSESALAGSRDLRVDFEYRNTSKAWDQWMYFSIPLTETVVDTRAMTGIRMTVRSSARRNLRVELESGAQTATTLGIRVGWDVETTPEAQTVERLFADAKVPSWAITQGTDPKDDLSEIRATVAGVAFHPYCLNRTSSGFLPDGVTDQGWIQIDDLQFY